MSTRRPVGVVHAKVMRIQQCVGLAIQAARHLADHMVNQPPEAQVTLACRVHHRAIELGKGHDQFWLALHRQLAVGRKPQRAQKKVRVRLQLWRGLRRQRLNAGHGVVAEYI